MIGSMWQTWIAPVPRPALVLGLAGLVPFVASTAMLLAGGDEAALFWRTVLLGYGVAILSFMGGVQWGLVMRQGNGGNWLGFSASVLPALAAWFALLLPPPAQLPALALGFALLLAYDLRTVRLGVAPEWYPNLRWPLTAVVVTCLVLASTVRMML